MEVDEQNSSGTEDTSDSESETGEPVTLTAIRPQPRILPPISQLNSPLAILSHFVRCVVDAWTGYQIAVSRKSGGPETSEKNEWLCEEIVKLLVKSNKLEVDDLIEWLSDILNEEFNLILEDNSVDTASKAFLEVARIVRERFVTKTQNRAPLSLPPGLPAIAESSSSAAANGALPSAPPSTNNNNGNVAATPPKTEHELVLENLQGYVTGLKF